MANDDPEWIAWLDTLPADVRVVAERFPPFGCCRSTENPGHYRVISYGHDRSNGRVVVEMAHGRDSYDPGCAVFGVDAGTLVPCNCGAWDKPTPEQMEAKRLEVEAIRAARGD